MILVLNCGSQSIKWKVFDNKLKQVAANKRDVLDSEKFDDILTDELLQIGQEINLIGHRVVHGGKNFIEPLVITKENLQELEKINHLAPLHNPYNILGIKACEKIFQNVKQVAVFDTEFFSQLPEVAKIYALPEKIAKEYGFYRYGFHGISNEYIYRKVAEKFKKSFNKLKIIVCHLGGGASISAINNGKAIDTSMGFTPTEGLVMMTRAGNIDSGIVLQLVKEFGVEGADKILNKESGIKGICGQEDMLKVLEGVKNDKKTKLAFDIFCYSVKKYIGAYFAILGGCDVLIFTGSIGAGYPKTRKTICKDLEILKKTKILAIQTNEELAIAQKILKLNNSYKNGK